MRVTQGSLTSDLLSSINRSKERILQMQAQLSSMKRVLKPSDDPQAAQVIVRLNGMLDRNAQYQKNVTEGQAAMQTTSSALERFSDLFVQAQQVITSAMNSADPGSLSAFADQIDQLLSQALDTANTQFNGRYMFGGTQTIEPPFRISADRSTVTANPNGIGGAIQYPVGEGISAGVNIDGQEAFNGTAPFTLLIQIRDALRSGVVPTQAQLSAANDVISHTTSEAGKAGTMLQNLTLNRDQLSDQHTQLETLLSMQQDVDVAGLVLNLKNEQNSLDAALGVGAKILPKSLVDFLT